MGRLFGTDGIRGTANVEPMTAETALRLGRALAHVSKRSPRRHKILIGKDTRLSGYMLETALASGICTMLCVTAPVGFIIWLLALRGVAVFFNRQRLARQVVVFLIACVLAVVGFCPAMIVVTFLVQASPAVGQVVGMIAVITSVVLTFWYLALLGAVRTTIDRARTGRLSY